MIILLGFAVQMQEERRSGDRLWGKKVLFCSPLERDCWYVTSDRPWFYVFEPMVIMVDHESKSEKK